MPTIEEVHDNDGGTDTGAGEDNLGQQRQPEPEPQPTTYNWRACFNHMTQHKVDTALWLSRISSIIFSVLYLVPVLGLSYATGSYQRALLANGVTNALRLHQRLPHFQLSAQYLGALLLEDSAHYLLYSLIFVFSQPVTFALTPVVLFALMHTNNYTKTLLNLVHPQALMALRRLNDRLGSLQVQMLRFIAMNEVILQPILIFTAFMGRNSILLPFVYYRFLTLRYASRRNPYSRQIFLELRVVTQNYAGGPSCPAILATFLTKCINMVSRLAPPTAPPQPQPQPQPQ